MVGSRYMMYLALEFDDIFTELILLLVKCFLRFTSFPSNILVLCSDEIHKMHKAV